MGGYTMTYQQYIAYHKGGDAGVEERMIASLARHYSLKPWDAFRLIYFYSMTYHIPSALDMLLLGERNIKQLHFRTDRRYVRCNGAYPRLLKELTQDKMAMLANVHTTQEAYDVVRSWYFFGRYAAFLFLEVYIHVFQPDWEDNIQLGWEADENYTKGAVLVAQSNERSELDKFINRARKDTQDNAFSLETSLCAVEKFRKGTRWNGYYTERMLEEAKGCKYENIIYQLAD